MGGATRFGSGKMRESLLGDRSVGGLLGAFRWKIGGAPCYNGGGTKVPHMTWGMSLSFSNG